MGYRKYAKDYEVEYQPAEGRHRKKAVRTYVGPYFRFCAPAERIRRLRQFYLIGLLIQLVLILVPLLVNCRFARLWYVQLPGVLRSIPMAYALMALWRLWTAGSQVEREHCQNLTSRMAASCFFLTVFSVLSSAGCTAALLKNRACAADYVVCVSEFLSFICSLLLFLNRKGLDMEQIAQAGPVTGTEESRSDIQ